VRKSLKRVGTSYIQAGLVLFETIVRIHDLDLGGVVIYPFATVDFFTRF
jgi:hypothetical protein